MGTHGAENTPGMFAWMDGVEASIAAIGTGGSTTDASLLTTGTVADARLPSTAQAATLISTYVSAFLPEAYGAVGNGTTDDTTALQAAITAAIAAGGGRVLLKRGTNYSSNGLLISGATGLIFDGNGAKITWRAGAIAQKGIQLYGTCTNVSIRDLTIVGDGVLADNHAGVYAGSSNTIIDCSVIGCRISNVTLGISVNFDTSGTLNGWLVQGNEITDVIGVTAAGQGYGIHVASSATVKAGVRIIGNHILRAQRHSIYLATGVGHLVANNVIEDHRSGVATGDVRTAMEMVRCSDVTVTGNYVSGAWDGCMNIAADTGNVAGMTVVGNTFTAPGNTVAMVHIGDASPTSGHTVKDVLLSGNRFNSASTGNPIYLDSGIDVTISGNAFNCTADTTAINLRGAGDTGGTATYNNRITLTGNTFKMAGGYTFRFGGIETSTAVLAVQNNVTVGQSSPFNGESNVSNPNITLGTQKPDGLYFGATHYMTTPTPIQFAATPTTLANVITILQAAGLCA